MIFEIINIIQEIKGDKFNGDLDLNENKEIDFLDSLEILNLIVGIETKFDISIEPDEIESIRRISDIEMIIRKKITRT